MIHPIDGVESTDPDERMLQSKGSEARLTWYTLACASFAAVGSLLYGIDNGIISTTIAHESFTTYFAPYTGGQRDTYRFASAYIF